MIINNINWFSMQLFFSNKLSKNIFTFDQQESRHINKVLRLKPGDNISVINGSGSRYETEICVSDPKKCEARVINIEESYNIHPYYLHIAIAPTKNTDRLEWFVEKSVEMGINEITPIICDNSERKVIKTDRLERIMISAMKQSHKGLATVINEARTFSDFLSGQKSNNIYIATCDSIHPRKHLGEVYRKNQDITILIGPEGDFSKHEVELACKAEYPPISLGQARLRTETAGLVACCCIYLMNQ